MQKSIRERIPPLRRYWLHCPYCGAKHSLFNDKAECRGVFLKCTRGCGKEFELVIQDGKQIAQ